MNNNESTAMTSHGIPIDRPFDKIMNFFVSLSQVFIKACHKNTTPHALPPAEFFKIPKNSDASKAMPHKHTLFV